MSATAAGYQDCLARGGMFDLSDRLKLTLTGADRVRYLHGQVTSNVQRLAADQAQPSCVTTAKGRLCGEVMITARLDMLLIDADAVLAETLPARLERYAIADDVTIATCPETTRLIHFFGDHEPLHSLIAPLSAFIVSGVNRLGRPGFDWWTTTEMLAEWRPKIEALCPVIDEALAEVLRIEAMIPRWGRELDENTLPPEAGLDRTHIDYHKGCYIGQEVISRLKSVGHVNRQLTTFVSTNGTPLSPGMQLFAAGDDTRPIGHLTSAAFSFALEKPIALGYLKRGSPVGEIVARSADATEAVVTVWERPVLS